MDKLIVNNSRSVSKILDFNVDVDTDLLEIDKCSDFISKYSNYFDTYDSNTFDEFFKNTGVIFAHMYITKDNQIYISDSRGVTAKRNIYDHHLLAISYVDEFNQYVVKLNNNNNYYKNIRYLNITYSLDEQIEFFKDKYSDFNYNNVKKIFYSSLNNLFILYNDGTLYRDGIFYSSGIYDILSLTVNTAYIIYKDNSIEYLTSYYSNLYNHKYNKVLYNDNFIAMLDDDKLTLEIFDSNKSNSYVCLSYYNVSDISYNDDLLNMYSDTGVISTYIPNDYNCCIIDEEEVRL